MRPMIARPDRMRPRGPLAAGPLPSRSGRPMGQGWAMAKPSYDYRCEEINVPKLSRGASRFRTVDFLTDRLAVGVQLY